MRLKIAKDKYNSVINMGNMLCFRNHGDPQQDLRLSLAGIEAYTGLDTDFDQAQLIQLRRKYKIVMDHIHKNFGSPN